MIKAVLFDFGGVLSPGGAAGSIKESISRVIGIAPEHIKTGRAISEAFIGTVFDQGFVDEINRLNACKRQLTVENFAAQGDLYRKSEPVYELAVALRQGGICTGILSNVLVFSAGKLRAQGFYDGFDPVILSCEVHLAKPNPEIYEYAMQQLSLQPHEVLFIDDKDEYLKPARSMGMLTVLAKEGRQIVADTAATVKRLNNITL